METPRPEDIGKMAEDLLKEKRQSEVDEESKVEAECAASQRRMEVFIENYADGTIDLPGGKCRDIREEIEYADCALSEFYQNGYDKGAKISKLMYNITFPIWRTVVFFTDIDTRDILLKVRNAHANRLTRGFMYLLHEIMQYAFKHFQFGKFLNEAREAASKYGKVLMKVAGNEVYVVSWYKIIAYDWQGQDDKHVRKVEEVQYSFEKALKYFEDFEDGVKERVEAEVEMLRNSDIDQISFYEWWDYHYIDGKMTWGKVVYMNRQNYAKMRYTKSQDLYQNKKMGEYDAFDELYRGVSGMTETYNGEESDRDAYVELDFINPIQQITRFGFGVPVLMRALQETMDDLSHLKRKGDYSAYKSIWLYQRGEGGDTERTVETSLKQGVEAGALLEYGPDEKIEHMTLGQPMQWFFNDYQFLEMLAMKIVGDYKAQESKANKTATQVNKEAMEQQATFNYFIEQQGIAFRELLSLYAKSLLMDIRKEGIISLIGDPKRIYEIRRFLFANHYNEHHKKIMKAYKKATGENPWLSDMDKLYSVYNEKMNKLFGEEEMPINLKKFKESIIKNLDIYFDFHVTKEALSEEKEQETYKFLLEQAQTDPYINRKKVMEKLSYSVSGTHDPDLYHTDEEVQAKLQRAQQAEVFMKNAEARAQAQGQAQGQAEGEAVQQEEVDEQGVPVQ